MWIENWKLFPCQCVRSDWHGRQCTHPSSPPIPTRAPLALLVWQLPNGRVCSKNKVIPISRFAQLHTPRHDVLKFALLLRGCAALTFLYFTLILAGLNLENKMTTSAANPNRPGAYLDTPPYTQNYSNAPPEPFSAIYRRSEQKRASDSQHQEPVSRVIPVQRFFHLKLMYDAHPGMDVGLEILMIRRWS